VSEAAALGTPTIAYNTPGLKDSTMAANGQLCPPNPTALAAFIVDSMPRLQSQPVEPIPYGGAHSWDEVADSMWTAVTDFLGTPAELVEAR
jgi:hypothetical protein